MEFTRRIGCIKESMPGESRVGLCPQGIRDLLRWTNTVSIEESAGERSGFPNIEYERAGTLPKERELIWRNSDLVVKVKQPLEEEFAYMQKNSTLFCFLHLADNLPLLDVLLEKRMTSIGYETIQLENGYIPILAQMSKIAGRIAFFDGAKLLMRHKGMMIGQNSTVVIIGLGNAGAEAAELAVMTNPKKLYLLDSNPEKFTPLKERFYQRLSPYDLSFVQYDHEDPSHEQALASILGHTDLVIGAAHIPGEKQAKLVPEWIIKNMQRGSVLIDISIDQGGCFETSRATSLRRPTFTKHGVVHYCVPNMPGITPRESTPALTQETFPDIDLLAQKGFKKAVQENVELARGVNTYKGWITHKGLAESIGRMEDYKPLSELL